MYSLDFALIIYVTKLDNFMFHNFDMVQVCLVYMYSLDFALIIYVTKLDNFMFHNFDIRR